MLTSKIIPIILLNLFLIMNSQDAAPICQLTGVANTDPFPSLVKCYKYNQDSCCSSVHDDYINSFINNLLTSSCARKYGELEDLFCYGCSPQEYSYTDTANKKIKICRSFLMGLWNATTPEDLYKPTTKFDNCGFKVNIYSPKGLKKLTDKPYIIPSHAFSSIEDFVEKLGLPFFSDYKLDIIDDTNITDTSSVCYMSADFISIKLFAFVSLLLILF